MSETKVATDADVTTKKLAIQVPVLNPLPVYDGAGRLIGSANVTLVPDGIEAELFLDKARPETFDMNVNPGRTKLTIDGFIDGDGLSGTITLS